MQLGQNKSGAVVHTQRPSANSARAGHRPGGAVLGEGPGNDGPVVVAGALHVDHRAAGVTGAAVPRLHHPAPGVSGSACTQSIARSAGNCTASSRVTGSCPRKGHARAEHSTTTGATGTRAARVVRVTPSTSATSVSGVPAVTMRVTCLLFATVMTVGRPPPHPGDVAAGPAGSVTTAPD